MKKIIKLVLCLLMLLSFVPVNVNADTKIEEIGGIEYTSGVAICNHFGEYEYKYSDTYFDSSAIDYNDSLATMSLCLALASYGCTTGNVRTSKNVRNLLNDIGFGNIEVNNYYDDEIPTKDSVATLCAYKDLGDYKLVVIIPRSANYALEWAGNFTIGKSGVAKNFYESGKTLYDFACDYLNNHSEIESGKYKIWIAGYSRGAAVANVTAALIDDAGNLAGKLVSKENTFVYTFGTPNTANTDTISKEDAKNNYLNIHNVINPNDVVSLIPPAEWGFVRYGVDHEYALASKTNENKEVFALVENTFNTYFDDYTWVYEAAYGSGYQPKKLNVNAKTLAKVCLWNTNWKLASKDYIINSLTKESDETVHEMIHNFVSALADAAGSRKMYVENYESLMRTILGFVEERDQEEANINKFWDLFQEKIHDNFGSLSAAIILVNSVKLNQLFTQIVKETLDECNLDVDDYTSLSKTCVTLVPLLSLALCDVAASGYADTICNGLYNLNSLVSGHYPEMCYSWVRNQDPLFTPAKYGLIQGFIENGNVSQVKVTINKEVKTTKFFKIKSTKYNVKIETLGNVQSITYKIGLLGTEKEYTTEFSSSTNIKDLTITIVDANGKVTHWYYNGIKTVQK